MLQTKMPFEVGVVPVVLVQDALLLADVARVVVLHQVVVELRRVVEASLAELTPGVSRLSQLRVPLQGGRKTQRKHTHIHTCTISVNTT